LANNKLETIKLANSLGINVPKIIDYSDLDKFDKISDQYVLKLRKGNSAKGVFYANNPIEAKNLFNNIIKEYKLSVNRLPIIQERVFGEGWGVSCLYWNGKRIAHFTHKRLREKTSTGGTSTLRLAAPNPILEEMAFAILDYLKWHGLARVEFKYDEKIKKGWFIEINPRMWGSIHLAIDSGVEFPYLLYLCCKVKEDKAKYIFNSTKIKYGNIARWYLGDLIILMQKLKKMELNNIFQLINRGIENSYDDIFLDDPLVFFGEILNYGLKFIKYRSTNPIEEGSIG
jgi:predicted ATP-grasp superfamily ATP-dependent carboligase